jgi:hypothetical protein
MQIPIPVPIQFNPNRGYQLNHICCLSGPESNQPSQSLAIHASSNDAGNAE